MKHNLRLLLAFLSLMYMVSSCDTIVSSIIDDAATNAINGVTAKDMKDMKRKKVQKNLDNY